MSKVINALTKHIEELTKLENFIIKTKEKSGKFSEAVIARLIIEFETKQDVVLEEAVPLAKELQEEASALQSEYDDIKSKFGDDERLQEEPPDPEEKDD